MNSLMTLIWLASFLERSYWIPGSLHTWIGKYHRAKRQEQYVHDEHLYKELKRLRKENARILLANPQVPKYVCPTCLLGRQKSWGNFPRKKYS
jgi:hypothetical protein